ncbi:MAG: hypothetical protein K8I04_13560 [Gammaproteobacteria bacterium]|nr:hypothetical protein [Gammaproteobacteria bacterium]
MNRQGAKKTRGNRQERQDFLTAKAPRRQEGLGKTAKTPRRQGAKKIIDEKSVLFSRNHSWRLGALAVSTRVSWRLGVLAVPPGFLGGLGVLAVPKFPGALAVHVILRSGQDRHEQIA